MMNKPLRFWIRMETIMDEVDSHMNVKAAVATTRAKERGICRRSAADAGQNHVPHELGCWR